MERAREIERENEWNGRAQKVCVFTKKRHKTAAADSIARPILHVSLVKHLNTNVYFVFILYDFTAREKMKDIFHLSQTHSTRYTTITALLPSNKEIDKQNAYNR